MTKKRDPSTLKVKPLLSDATVFADWRTKLTCAIHLGRLNTFWTLKEIRTRWGNRGVREFKYWFGKVKKHYNADHSYTWIWELEEARTQDAWKIIHGLESIDTLMKGAK